MSDDEVFDFTLDHYSECLSIALKKSYRFFPLSLYEEAMCVDKCILNRHDVDTQLDVALEMAHIENSLGISSTYFLRFHSHTYNLMNVKHASIVRQISDLGHEIGLHFEPDFYSMIESEFNKCIDSEILLLSEICRNTIKSVAPHEPRRTQKWNLDNDTRKRLDITVEAYDKCLIDNFKYISDSSCNWREGSMFYHIQNETYNKLYILTHPYWWFKNSPIENY